jgi:hypothetical protein
MTAAITTAIAQFRHAFPLDPPYVYGYGLALFFLLSAVAIALVISRQEQVMPQIVAIRYRKAAWEPGISSRPYQVGESGLVLANHGGPLAPC